MRATLSLIKSTPGVFMFGLLLAPILAMTVPPPPVAIVPGKSLGPVTLGASEADLIKAGLTVKPGRFETERRVGAFDVSFKNGKVSGITFELGKGPMGSGNQLRIGEVRFAGTTPQQIATHLSGCGPMQRNRGGNVIECTSGAMITQSMGGMGVRVVPVQIATRTPWPMCAGYLEPGNPKSKLEIEPKKTYCLPTRVVSDAVRPADVLGRLRYNTCQTQVNLGATIVTCPFQGTRFVFAGPNAMLVEVSGVPMKK